MRGNKYFFALFFACTHTITTSQMTQSGSFGNAGRPILGSKKKERVDLGPPIFEENEVQILVDADWDENLLFHEVYLVLFHEAGCQETEKFLAEYEAAADVLIVTEPFTPLAKVDCRPNNRKTVNICAKVTATLPTIRLYRNEEFIIEYSGPRDRKSLITFVQNVNQAGSVIVHKAKEINNLLKNSTDKFFVSFAYNYKNLQRAYKKIAEELRPYGVHFYHINGPLKSKVFSNLTGRVVMFTPHHLRGEDESQGPEFSGRGKTEPDLRTWLEESYFRPFGLRLISNQALYERDLVVVIYSSLSSHNMWRYVRNRATWLGQQHFRRQCTEQQMENSCQAETFNNFKVTVADKEDFRAELNDCGFSPEVVGSTEVLVCGIYPDRNRVPMQEQFSKSNLHIFTRQLLTTSLSYFLHTGKIDLSPRHEVGLDLTRQLDAYELVEEINNPDDRVFLLLGRNFTENRNEQFLVDAFFSASENLNKELDFVWLSLEKNEIAPNLLDTFTREETRKTGIFVKTDRITVKFSPVTAGGNLPQLLLKFIRQRKEHFEN